MERERQFIMKWPELDRSVECAPLKFNRKAYEWWMDHLPIRAVQSHAAVTGWCMYSLNVRLPETMPSIPQEEIVPMLMTEAPVGYGRLSYNQRGGLCGGRIGNISVIYGPLTEAMPASYCFRVIEKDHEILKEVGLHVWEAMYRTKEIITVELNLKR